MRLLVLTPTRDDTTSLYRAAGVMKDLQRKMPDLQYDLEDIDSIKKLTWSVLKLYDIVYLQRPYKSQNLVAYCKDLGIPIWVDYDDNLLELPRINERATEVYSNDPIRSQLKEIAKMATVVTVSTAELGRYYGQFNKNVKVIPNALDIEYIGPPREKVNEKKVIMWRGGDSHRGDVYRFSNQIFPATLRASDWSFLWAGFNFAERMAWYFGRDILLDDLADAFGNNVYEPAKDPTHYFRWIRDIGPRALHFPLEDSLFNRCKSNIAALEGTWSGAVCLVPDWEEWQIPGTIRYNNPVEYGEKLKMILEEQFSFNKYRGQALDYIMEHYRLSRINNLRKDLINELMNTKA